MRVTLRYVHEFRDRHGKLRRYYRRKGYPYLRLPGRPGSDEFMLAYNAAAASCVVKPATAPRSGPGTVSAAIGSYYTGHQFLALSRLTQQSRRAILERFRRDHGEKKLAGMGKAHVAKILSARKPFAARNWLKALRGLMQYAVEIGLREDDPTKDIEPAKVKEGRIHTWTEEEIAQFEARHPIGTRARLAMALLLYTGQRRGDVVRMPSTWEQVSPALWREGYEAGLTAGQPPLRRGWPNEPMGEWARISGYDEGRRLLASPAFQAGYKAGLAGHSLPADDEPWWDNEDWLAGNARARLGGAIAA